MDFSENYAPSKLSGRMDPVLSAASEMSNNTTQNHKCITIFFGKTQYCFIIGAHILHIYPSLKKQFKDYEYQRYTNIY